MPDQPGARRYPHLFSPFTLAGVRLENRLVIPGLTTNYGNPDGSVSDELCAYIACRARGGFGLITTENIGIHECGRVMPRMIMAHEDRFIPGLARLAKSIKAQGVPAFAQLSHPGRQTKSSIAGGELVAPSPIPCPINKEMPRALGLGEIEAMERAFIDAAVRLREAGFDGIEVHAAHGYLIAGFLSRYSNMREDAYGGSLANRMRFLNNIVDGVKSRLGAGFPLVVRISALELVDKGIEVPEAVEIGNVLARHGVDALSLSVGVYETFNQLSMVSGEPEGQWLDMAGEVRAGVALPVVGVGRMIRASVAESALAAGKIDLAAFGRASMSDPDLPAKIAGGREDRIMVCAGCNQCLGRSARPRSICPVNPAIGRESRFRFGKVARPRRVAVIGGAYAAMTAAWIAAAKGHHVTLDLDGQEPGGLMRLRARVPGQAIYGEVTRALMGRAARAGVKLGCGPTTRSDFDVVWTVIEFAPALGHGAGGLVPVVQALDLLADCRPAAARRAVVIGDDLCAAEAAIVLAAGGSQVTLLSPAPDIAFDAHPGFREVSRRALAAAGASVAIKVRAPFEERAIGRADLIVVGRDAAAGWDDEISWRGDDQPAPATGVLKDAYEPGRLTRAIYEAVETAMAIE